MIDSVFRHEFKNNGAVTFCGKYVLWYNSLNLWNEETNEDVARFASYEDAMEYELDGKKIKDIVAEADLSLFQMVLNGGSGSGSPTQKFKFGHADQRGKGNGNNGTPDLPARMNVKVKNKTEHDTIQAFRKEFNKSGTEHGIAIDSNGYVWNYTHGDNTSVMIGARGKGDLIVHNHPNGGHFSDMDLISMAKAGERGVVATNPKGYYRVDRGTHFQAENFARAIKNATMSGTSYDDAVHRWLQRNQKKYGYKYERHMDKKVKQSKPKTVKVPEIKFDVKGVGSLF